MHFSSTPFRLAHVWQTRHETKKLGELILPWGERILGTLAVAVLAASVAGVGRRAGARQGRDRHRGPVAVLAPGMGVVRHVAGRGRRHRVLPLGRAHAGALAGRAHDGRGVVVVRDGVAGHVRHVAPVATRLVATIPAKTHRQLSHLCSARR